ncbi:DUF3015 domain-containing protein [Nitrosococcus oceani]|uniref:DUF3015 domain-containing protein n=1 Tax=Nitrosococcus oceani TaxID=1229 RepID=UPI0004E88815|nr:DUF3015 domain-containing protein [Nitrosococcus oceani]KFI22243.1 signal peptide protein [Nitrosococcus oceani]
MRKVFLGLLLAAISGFAFADSGPGCGAGSVLFKGQDRLAPHVLAATTNASFGNQTFGMTTGTLGCDTSKPIDVMAANFFDQNMEQLATDMSRGEGEHLNALITLMKVQEADKNHFKATVKNQFSVIFPNQNVTSKEALSGLEKVMKGDAALAKYLS